MSFQGAERGLSPGACCHCHGNFRGEKVLSPGLGKATRRAFGPLISPTQANACGTGLFQDLSPYLSTNPPSLILFLMSFARPPWPWRACSNSVTTCFIMSGKGIQRKPWEKGASFWTLTTERKLLNVE